MKRNNAGVTISALVVTVIVLTIMFSVIMKVSAELLSDSKIKSYIAEMYMVQARVKSIAETLEFESDNYNIADCNGNCGVFYEKLLTNATIGSLLKDLNYYESGRINKIGTKINVLGEDGDLIPGTADHEEYKVGEMAKCWYKWDINVLADNGFDANMLDGSTYFVNYYNYEVVYSKGFTTNDRPRHTYHSLSDLLKVE